MISRLKSGSLNSKVGFPPRLVASMRQDTHPQYNALVYGLRGTAKVPDNMGARANQAAPRSMPWW